MLNPSRKETINILLSNAAECGATDLMAFAIEQGADVQKEDHRALGCCIETDNRDGFDLLINSDAEVTASLFENRALYHRQHRGNDLNKDSQYHFVETMLSKTKPHPFTPRNHRAHTCLSSLIESGREDMYALMDDKLNITSLLTKEHLVSFVMSLSHAKESREAFVALLIDLIERYRPLSLVKQGEDGKPDFENEDRFVKKLFQLGMTEYLNTLDAAGEVQLHRKQVLDHTDSIEYFFASLKLNPNLRLSSYALQELLSSDTVDSLTEAMVEKLIRHTEPKQYCRSHSFDNILKIFASHERIDLIITTIDTALTLPDVVEDSTYSMIFDAFEQINTDSRAIAFLNTMLADSRYHSVLMERWEPNLDSNYSSGATVADWLLGAKNKPTRLSALLNILPVSENAFLRYTERLSNRNRQDESTLEEVLNKPYLLHAVLNHPSLSDEMKDAFRKAVSYHFEYAERSPESAIKMLTGNKKKMKDRLKGELAARFIIASPDEQKSTFVTFYRHTDTALLMIKLLGISPLDAISNYHVNNEVQAELLKQAC